MKATKKNIEDLFESLEPYFPNIKLETTYKYYRILGLDTGYMTPRETLFYLKGFRASFFHKPDIFGKCWKCEEKTSNFDYSSRKYYCYNHRIE